MSGSTRPTHTPPTASPGVANPVAGSASIGSPPAATSSPLEDLRRIGGVVTALGRALSLSPERLARAEALDRLEFDTDLPLAQLETWDVTEVASWFANLGPDLRIDLVLPTSDQERNMVASLRSNNDPAQALTDFLDVAREHVRDTGDDCVVSARLAAAKTHARETVSALLATRPEYLGISDMLAETQLAVFYSAAAFHRLLSIRALNDWERLGLARPNGRALVVLCDRAGYLAGPALEVLGARETAEPRWLPLSRAAFRQFHERADRMHALRDEESAWLAAPGVLTPAHLRVTSRAPGLEDTAAHLASVESALAAAYVASSVQSDGTGNLLLRFAGPRPATCRIAAESAPASLSRLCAWAYENASPDKLAIVRECLAGELPPGAEVSLARLSDAASGALDAAKANFTLYLRRGTEHYFTERQKALDAVTAYTTAVRTSVSDLTGDVVDNVYRTAGLLVAVIIAALIQPSLSIGVARLASFVYVLYILLLLAFFMRARWRRFELERASLEDHLTAMAELGPSMRAVLRRQPASAEAYFVTYFQRAWRIYAGLGVAAVVLCVVLWTPLAPLTGLPHSPLFTPTSTPTLTR